MIPLNVQINYAEKAGDVIFETSGGRHIFHFGYLNDSAIQATLANDDVQNAQYTLTLLNPHTLHSLITWETSWPANIKEAACKRIDRMKENGQRTLVRYQEIAGT
ncbi:hypothetical protein, partial [Salmonella sp. s55044]|uniref:hypothetical protein n=1 Tax=Salmonella sp. s55044 TaxID=3159677 RepID=UPI0039801AD8